MKFGWEQGTGSKIFHQHSVRIKKGLGPAALPMAEFICSVSVSLVCPFMSHLVFRRSCWVWGVLFSHRLSVFLLLPKKSQAPLMFFFSCPTVLHSIALKSLDMVSVLGRWFRLNVLWITTAKTTSMRIAQALSLCYLTAKHLFNITCLRLIKEIETLTFESMVSLMFSSCLIWSPLSHAFLFLGVCRTACALKTRT